MPHPWEAEHPVSRELATQLIADQFPELAGAKLTRLGEGWDNDVWLAGEAVFRFPRRAVAIPLLATEAAALPGLAPLLPLAVPVPVYRGRPTEDFPYPWLGYRLLTGETGDRTALSDLDRAALAAPLAGFLKTLHGVSAERAHALGIEDDRFRSDMPRFLKLAHDRLKLVETSLPAETVARIRTYDLPPPSAAPRVPCHGDLYARHLLFDAARRLCAVIDWGDLCLADPAVDLAIAYSALPAAARPAFFAAYGPVSADAHARARLSALARHGLTLLAYARDRGDAPLEAEARGAIDRALAL